MSMFEYYIFGKLINTYFGEGIIAAGVPHVTGQPSAKKISVEKI